MSDTIFCVMFLPPVASMKGLIPFAAPRLFAAYNDWRNSGKILVINRHPLISNFLSGFFVSLGRHFVPESQSKHHENGGSQNGGEDPVQLPFDTRLIDQLCRY